MIRAGLAPHLSEVAVALTRAGQPEATFLALDRALAATLGHRLFTMLLHHDDTRESERIYTNQPHAYPVGGRKPLRDTAWARQVIGERRAFIGRTARDIETHFPDHALIASLGCASIVNLPVVWNGRLLGTINLLHEERWYDDGDVPIRLLFAALAVPAYLVAASRAA